MRYWAYTNNEVGGPFEKEQLAKLPNFTASSLICPETPAGGQTPDWKEASTFPEVSAILTLPAPPPVKPRRLEESPLALTMRGSLIADESVTPPAAEPPAAFSLTPITALKSDVLEPPKETPKPVVPDKPPAIPENIPASRGPDPQPEQLKQQLEQMNTMLVSIGDTQVQLLGRLSRLESAIMEIKTLLSPDTPKK